MRSISLAAILFLFISSCKRDPYLNADYKTYKDTTFTNYFKRTDGWVAGDGAYSIPLSNGQSLWTFGDSYINSYDAATRSVPCLFQARNALLLMGINDPTNQTTVHGNGGTNSYFLPADGDHWIWPGTGYQNGDTIYAFVGKLGKDVPDTELIAKINVHDLSLMSYYTMPDRHGISFANSLIKEGGYYYVYGTKDNGFGRDLFVARFAEGNIYGTWQYYSSNGWTEDINSISRIWDEFTSSFYVCKVKSKYVLITTEFSVGCDQGKNIFAATANNPYGPFESQHSIWQLDDTLQGHYPFFYIANPHPEYDNGKNELLITYCINGYGDCVPNTCFNGRMDPNIYRPKAIRVPYKAIDPAL